MAIYQTARFQVKQESLETCQEAIRDFIAYVAKMEKGKTLYYWSWQQTDDPTRFMNVFAFADEEAREAHRNSEAIKRFTATLYPELVGGVEYAEYKTFATT